jgi:hypothetical protein
MVIREVSRPGMKVLRNEWRMHRWVTKTLSAAASRKRNRMPLPPNHKRRTSSMNHLTSQQVARVFAMYPDCKCMVSVDYGMTEIKRVNAVFLGTIGSHGFFFCYDINGNKWEETYETTLEKAKLLLTPLSAITDAQKRHVAVLQGFLQEDATDYWEIGNALRMVANILTGKHPEMLTWASSQYLALRRHSHPLILRSRPS